MSPKPTPSRNTPVSREDSRRHHRRRSRLIMLRRLLVLVIVAVLAVVLWRNWDTMAPDKLLAKLQDSMQASAGTYPVDISGTHVSVLTRSEGYLFTLSDSYLTFYNTGGGEVNRFPCTYSSPLCHTAGRFVLLAEQDGKRVQLYTRTALQTELTAKEEILAVALNADGRFAVLTRGSQSYAAQVTVYERDGTQVYTRSRSKLATAVALSPDGEHLALLSVEANGGSLNSLVEVFPLSGSDTAAVYSHTLPGTLLYRLDYLQNARLSAVGEAGALLINTKENVTTPYTADTRRVLGYAANEDGVALVLREYGDTAGGTVAVVDKDGREVCTVPFTGEFRHLSTDGDSFLLLTDAAALRLDRSGADGTAAIEADGQRAALAGDTAVVLGLNTIQAYTLE